MSLYQTGNAADILLEPVELRLSCAKNPESSPEILRVLSKDSFWFVRDYVASNSNTPEDCLLELLQERDFRIRYDAEKTLRKKAAMQRSLDKRIESAIGKAAPQEVSSSRKLVPIDR